GIGRAGCAQTMRNVGCGLILAEGREDEARNIRAEELAHPRRCQYELERGLTEQQDLQHRLPIDLERGETAELLEHRWMHALRILDDEQTDAPHGGLVVEEALE